MLHNDFQEDITFTISIEILICLTFSIEQSLPSLHLMKYIKTHKIKLNLKAFGLSYLLIMYQLYVLKRQSSCSLNALNL